MDKNTVKAGFNSYLIRWGRITNIIGMACGFLPCLVLWLVYGYTPNWEAVGLGLVPLIAAAGIGWFTDPIASVPVLGVPGTMMGFLSGNVNGVRIPASTIAQDVAGTEPGTPEASVISTIGIATSTFVSAIVLTIFAIAGSALLQVLPQNIITGFNYMLPCVFGAVFISLALKEMRLAPVTVCVSLGLRWLVKLGVLPAVFSNFIIIITIVVVIAVGIAFYKKDMKKKAAKQNAE